MRKLRVLFAVFGIVSGFSALAAAHEGDEGHQKQITGEVVDLACYLSEGAKGAGHQSCAQKCIASGLPVGIKTADTLYLVIGGEHGAANKDLAPLAAKTVTAEGAVTERDGVHLLALKKVTVKGA